MLSSPRRVPARRVLVAAALASLAASHAYVSVTPTELPSELSFTAVLATGTLRDTARVAGVQGGMAVHGLLNQTPPCFGLSASATREGARIVLRLSAREAEGTCNTFAAGAFDYDVGVTGLVPGTYDADVLHRVQFKDGRVTESRVGAKTVVVR